MRTQWSNQGGHNRVGRCARIRFYKGYRHRDHCHCEGRRTTESVGAVCAQATSVTRFSTSFFVVLLCFGCGSSPRRGDHPKPLAASEHDQEAREHSAEAERSEAQISPDTQAPSDSVTCIDSGIPLSTGGERVEVMKPCWTNQGTNDAYREAAAYHRDQARKHREDAAQMRQAERVACAGLGEDERSQSLFYHAKDITKVDRYDEGNSLRGATVTFRKVPGLTKEWANKSIACHQARAAALGYDEHFMSYCPLVVKGALVIVRETPSTIVVTVRSRDPIAAATIYGRSEASPTVDHSRPATK